MNSEVGIAEFIDVVPYDLPINGKHLVVFNDYHSSSSNNLPWLFMAFILSSISCTVFPYLNP